MYSSHNYKRTFITSKYDTVYYYSADSIDSEVGWKCYTFSFKSIMTFYKTHNSSGENFQIYKISSFSPHCNIPIRPCKLKIKKNNTLRYNCINRKKKTFHYFIFIPVYNNTKNCSYNTLYLKAELQLKIREKYLDLNDQLTCLF